MAPRSVDAQLSAEVAFALASALHAGFQLTVTVLVYPVLAGRSAEEWASVHARHSRAITPVVALVYAAVVASGACLVASGPGLLAVIALAGSGAALATTAFAAAPLHGRLGARDNALVARLLVADRWRCGFALAGALAAGVAVAAPGPFG